MQRETVHGGDEERVARTYGFDLARILDYSANINPLPLPQDLGEYLTANLDCLSRYPDRHYLDLRNALSLYTGCPVERIMAGNGATELIYLAARAIKPRRALLPAPSFADYRRALREAGCRVDLFPLREEEGFRLDVDLFLHRLARGYDLTILCNPNNPTGQLLNKEQLCQIAEEARRQGVLVLLDECFVEFVPDVDAASMTKEVLNYENLLVLRAFTKFFSVPGLRLGYCLADPKLLEKMAAYKEPWSVNALASLLGPYLLSSRDFIAKSRRWITEERPWMLEELQAIPGLKVYASSANFILFKILAPGWDAKKLKTTLESRGIMIRDAGSFDLLDHSYVRLAVKDREGNQRMLRALREALSQSFRKEA